MTVGLHMIVKNEAHVIERCLRTVIPYIDWWTISDTGSTDGTQAIIRNVLGDIPGMLTEDTWKNFGHNRQIAFENAEKLAKSLNKPYDHVMWIDADDEFRPKFDKWPELVHPGYLFKVEYANLIFDRVTMVRANNGWRWKGAVHECLLGNIPVYMPEAVILQHHDGARSKDPSTYLKDIALLEEELKEEPNNPRSQFYLAQSYRDAHLFDKAIQAYAIRAANKEGWEQERAYCFYRIGQCMLYLNYPTDKVIEAFSFAIKAAPNRAEPVVALAGIYRREKNYELAYQLALHATTLEPSSNILFCEADSYRDGWKALDELSVNAFYTGNKEIGKKAALRACELNPYDTRLKQNLSYFV